MRSNDKQVSQLSRGLLIWPTPDTGNSPRTILPPSSERISSALLLTPWFAILLVEGFDPIVEVVDAGAGLVVRGVE